MTQTTSSHATHRANQPVQTNYQHRDINQGLLSQPEPTQSNPGPGIFQANYLETESGNRPSKILQFEYLKENRNPSRQRGKNQGNCRHSYNLRIKRSNLSVKRLSDLQLGEPVVPLVQAHGVHAHGVGGGGGGEGEIFLSANNTVVETTKGTDISINCRIARDSDYGTVSIRDKGGQI